MATAGPQYFYEDEVFRVLKSGDIEFGMVTENWEMYSSDEDSDPDKVPTGSVAVTWHPKGKDEVVPEGKVKLSDRSLMPGDVVRRLIAGKDTQRGYCRSVKVTAAVQIIGSKKVVPNVLANELLPVQKLQTDVAVYLDSWIGVIRDIIYRLSLRFPDGSACTIDSHGILDHFEDTRRNQEGFGSSDAFYPGQKLLGAMRYLRDADWTHFSDDLKRAKDRKLVTVTVIDVNPSSVNVQWQWQTPENSSSIDNITNNKEKAGWQKDPPPDLIEEKDLKRVKCLNLFESCTVQLGDISFYTPSAKDIILEKNEWKKTMAKTGVHPPVSSTTTASKSKSEEKLSNINNKDSQQAPNERPEIENSDPLTVSIAVEGNNNSVDGKAAVTGSVTSKKAFPRVCTRTLRKKKLKKTRQTSNTNVSLDAPVVVETVHTRSTVDVVWQDGTIEEGMSSVDLYPIHHLDDHEFFPGDFVVRAESVDFRTYGVIQNMDHNGRVAHVTWFEAYSFNGDQFPKELHQDEMSVYDIKDHPDYRFRPGTIVIRVANQVPDQYSAGQILDNYPDGQVRVWWANGSTSSCWPQDLFRLGDYDSDDGEIWDDNGDASDKEDDDGASSDSSWETEAEEELNEADSAQRYQTIGKLIEHIQKTLVCTRETIVASTPTSLPSETEIPNSNLSLNVDRRGITKKLLLIYKDCQYLDKIMGSKHFDESFLKEWFKQMEATSKSGRMSEQVSKLFELPDLSLKMNKSSSSDFKGKEDNVVLSVPNLAKDMSIGDALTKDEESNTHLAKEAGIAVNVDSDECKDKIEDEKIGEESASTSELTTAKSQTIFVTELCSLILTKLLAAHSEYESRFGVGGDPKSPKAADSFTTLASIAEEIVENSNLNLDMGVDNSSTDLAQSIKDLCLHTKELAANLADDTIASEIQDLANKLDTSMDSKDESSTDLTSLFKSSDLNASPVPKLSIELGLPKDKLSSINNNNSEDGEIQVKFSIVDNVPDTHRYRLTTFMPQNQKSFLKTVQKEVALLRESLPEGIFVKGYEDRMDLFSVMICGPENTPYEDGIFLFDIQLPATYPAAPPSVHYVSFCPDRLNPNLYECGKVCVSLLGTWSGKGTEVWTASSSLLQLLISIQGLILVPEPYYNEAGYEKQRGSQQGEENSRMYNEMVLIKLVQSMSRMFVNRHSPWENEITQYIQCHNRRLIDRYYKWLQMSEDFLNNGVLEKDGQPGFPLLPVSKGFSITLKKTLENYAKLCDSNSSININNPASNTTVNNIANASADPPTNSTTPPTPTNVNVVAQL